MKRVILIVLALLLVVSFVWAENLLKSPKIYSGQADRLITGNEPVQIPANAPRFEPPINELDEIIGDTVYIGFTWWESQHNGTVGRMIGYYPGDFVFFPDVEPDTVDGAAFMSFMCLESGDQAGERHIRFNRVGTSDDGTLIVEFTGENALPGGGSRVDAANRAGYTSQAMDSENGLAFPAYHFAQVAGADYVSKVAAEFLPMWHGAFNEMQVPEYDNGVENIWPRTTYGYDSVNEIPYVYTLTTANREDPVGQQDILYSRHQFLGSSQFDPADEQLLVTDEAMNISGEIAVSNDGQRVAIAQTIGRDYIYWEELDPRQWNNDLYIWESFDGGATFDWDNPLNLTDFALPDPGFLPDDVASANTDTFRCYTDVNLYYDHNDVLHAAFTTPMFYFYDENQETGEIGPERTSTRSAVIFHWDEESNEFHLIADGDFWNYAIPGAWQRIVNRPSMYQDPVSGVLYCVFQRYGNPGENTYIDEENFWGWDSSDDWYANGEIMVVASPPNNDLGDWYGRLWTQPVNITNTANDSCGIEDRLAAGDCRSEREPSVALNNDGSYLNIMYVLDLDGGFFVQTDANDNPEGEATENPVIFHRVAKDTLINRFNGWLPNYPMHHDSVGFWVDDYEYAWEHDDWVGLNNFFRSAIPDNVNEKHGLLPGEFQLEQNYPNPFNPTTHISFTLKKRGMVKLAVYDVLGREVAVLTNRAMEYGRHTYLFEADNLASGMYFITLTSGENVKTRKMVLMK